MMRWVGDVDGGGSRKAVPGQALVLGWQSPLMRTALAALLEQFGHEVIASGADWAGVRAARAHAALAVIDIDLLPPGARGVAGMPLVVIAPAADHPAIPAALDGAAAGLVLGSENSDALRSCLLIVAGGGRWVDRSALGAATERSAACKDVPRLTRRERDVARLVATGQRNRAIAGSLGISEGTVKMHLHNVYSKLGLESRTQLAMDERLRTGA